MKEQYIVGRNPVLEVLKTDKEIEKIYISKGELKGSVKRSSALLKMKCCYSVC